MIRVLLADDHPVVRAGLRGMLAAEADIEVAGEAASGPEAVARARTGGFDVILMDLRMPGGDGVAATEQILAADPGARQVRVRLCYAATTVRLTVTDDGKGFDPGATHGGYGLTGMRDRVSQVGGTVEVASVPGRGTEVSAEVPG